MYDSDKSRYQIITREKMIMGMIIKTKPATLIMIPKKTILIIINH